MKAPNSLCGRSPEFCAGNHVNLGNNSARHGAGGEISSTGNSFHALAVAAKKFPMFPMFPHTTKHTNHRSRRARM
jgi:hypothetical protein